MARIKHLTPLVLLLSALLFTLPTAVAQANAAPPPARIWFTFESQPDTSLPAIQGAQLLGCQDQQCATPQLLLQYGQCNRSGCLENTPLLSTPHSLECAGNRCLFTFYTYQGTSYPAHSRLIVQFSDETRTSGIFDTALKVYTSTNLGYRCTLQTDRLEIVEDPTFQNPAENYPDLFQSFALTLGIELLIAAGLIFLRRQDWKSGLLFAGSVLFINLISYPVVWLGIPSLAQFQNDAYRTVGYYFEWAAFIYAVAVLGIAFTRKKLKKALLILTLISIPLVFFLSLMVTLIAGYGNYDILAQGISPQLTIFLAELFAVTFETALLYALHRKTIPFWQIAVYSLLANLASFLAGWIVFQ